jgi:hypothetical protein
MITKILKRVQSSITGRHANAGNIFQHLAEVIQIAGDGNYLEIGVLNGGSIACVGLWKKHLKHKGVCVGVDPFDGYYKAQTGLHVDKKTGIPVTIELAQKNIDLCDLDNVQLIQAHSPNFDVGDMRFAVSFIDGDHSEEGAFSDWVRVKEITDRFVVFHDYGHLGGVTRACERAALDMDWKVYHKGEFVFILERK